MGCLHLVIIVDIIWFLFTTSHAVSYNDNININNALHKIEESSSYNITDSGYLLKNASGEDYGNPGGGYGHYQFNHNTINTEKQWAGLITEFLISPNDAIIFIGLTPPLCKYFSFSLYLTEQLLSSNYSNDRIELFSSLIPSLNHLLINTSSPDHDHDVFNQTVIIICTASKQTYSDLYQIFASFNLSEMINLMPIVSDYVNFTKYNESITNYNVSTLNVVLRVALPNNLTTYYSFMAINQSIKYVSSSDKISNNISNQYWSNNWKENTYSPFNINETEKYSQLFLEYQQDIISYLQSPPYNMKFDRVFDFFSPYYPNNISFMANYGWQCIDQGVNCKVDNRDCYYSVNDNVDTPMLYNNNTFWLIVGINHFKTNQTTYSLLALYEGNPNNVYVKSYEVDNFQYDDKQLLYNKTNQKYSMFFSVQFSRKHNCLPNLSGFCMDINRETPLYIILGRDYLNPITKTRPNESQLIKHVLMKFVLP